MMMIPLLQLEIFQMNTTNISSPQAASYSLELLEILLKAHDWHYQHSDDGSVWRRGSAQWQELNRCMEYLNEISLGQAVTTLYGRHCPWSRADDCK